MGFEITIDKVAGSKVKIKAYGFVVTGQPFDPVYGE